VGAVQQSYEQAAGVPRRPRLAWLWSSIWLIYAYYPAREAFHEPVPQRVIGLVALAMFVATYVIGFAIVPLPIGVVGGGRGLLPAGLVALSGALGVVVVAVVGEDNLPVFVYVVALAMFVLPIRWGVGVLLAVVLGSYLSQLLVPGWHVEGSVEFQVVLTGAAMFSVRQLISRNRALALAHQEIARLAAREERNRLARDLHDILGHSLTVVAVKAELAGRLVRLDPDRAEREITDVERLARDALTEVRAAVAGSHEVTLATELANARTALTAAGIDAELPTGIDDVPAERRELFGWVVREGVTNVVRHSGASRCRVEITTSSVSVRDDGPAATAAGLPAVSRTNGGHGLLGLGERATAAGGSLLVGRAPEGGFALTVSV
jgi:two-component system sensor histidine kinase DesK